MARDYYVEFPIWFISDPAVLRLKCSLGMAGVGCFYELCAMASAAYQEQRHVTADDLPAVAYSWHMGEGEARAAVDEMARCGLIIREMWEEDGIVGVPCVAERVAYRMAKAEAGKASGEARRRKRDDPCRPVP